MAGNPWEGYCRLFHFAQNSPVELDGETSCFELAVQGSPIETDDGVLVRVTILQHLQGCLSGDSIETIAIDHPCRKAVLRMNHGHWAAVGRHSRTIRAMWTQVHVRDTVVILDATQGPAFLTGDVQYRQDEVLHMAEIFSGGFAGWTQAGWVLQEMRCPVRTDWLLDIEEAVQASLEALMPQLRTVRTAPELPDETDFATPIFLSANVEHTWWHGIWSLGPPDIVTLSPPCQPWSTAGQQGGLSTADGRLLLLLADIMSAIQTPVVCLEEVAGFFSRQDYAQVMQAWASAGYHCIYNQSLQLAEVAPTWRKRCLLVLVHDNCGAAAQRPLQALHWNRLPRPSLNAMQAYFPVLPASLLRTCEISAEALAVYLDPWFLPPGLPGTEWFLQAPYHLFESFGWNLECQGPVMEASTPLCFQLCLDRCQTCLPASAVPGYLRELLFLAQLRYHAKAADTHAQAKATFVLQVGTRTLAQLALPEHLRPRDLEEAWASASQATGCWPGARIFSGPRPLAYDAALATLRAAASLHVQRASGLEVLCIATETRGGGVKDENVQLAKSKVAALLLDRGVPLSDASQATESLVPAVGATTCLHALAAQDPTKQWHQLSRSAAAVGRPLPEGDNRAERAAQRLQKAVRKKKLAQATSVNAADFQLDPDTWHGIDDNPVPVLTEIRPACNGAILMDPQQANPQDIALLRNMGSDALCIVLPGHACPDPDTCSGAVSVPVIHKESGQRHLLAACYHNVGETEVRPHFAHGTKVVFDGTVCCSFTMHADEAQPARVWQDAIKAPVRTVVDLFRSRGVQQAFPILGGAAFERAAKHASLRPLIPSSSLLRSFALTSEPCCSRVASMVCMLSPAAGTDNCCRVGQWSGCRGQRRMSKNRPFLSQSSMDWSAAGVSLAFVCQLMPLPASLSSSVQVQRRLRL